MVLSHPGRSSVRGWLVGLALACIAPPGIAADPTFVGTWETTYGRMVLTESDGKVSGTYGGKNGIIGTVAGTRFTFKYIEPGVTGEGYFEISPDGATLTGQWRPAGRESWSSWTGRRARELPVAPGAVPPQPGAATPAEAEEPKPKVIRYGHLPHGLPPYFYTSDGDMDKDGQIGLYEWAKLWDPKGVGMSEEKLVEFKALDLNADGLLTAEEYLRAKRPTQPATGASIADQKRVQGGR
jgi:hypothetical protein